MPGEGPDRKVRRGLQGRPLMARQANPWPGAWSARAPWRSFSAR